MGHLLSRLSLIFERPRFSLEAAYVGALLIFLVFGGAPTRSVGDIASTTFAGFQLNLAKFIGDTPDALSVSWNHFYGSCKDRMEGTIETSQKTIGGSIQSLQGYAERLKSMSDTHLVKPAVSLIQEVTLKYEAYSGNLNTTEDSETRPAEPAE